MKLFVYGTLKRDGALGNVLKDSKFLGEYTTKSKGYAMTSAGGNSFPFVYYTNQNNPYRIKGELFDVDFGGLRKAINIERSAGYKLLEIDDDIYSFIYPKQIGTYSNNIRVDNNKKVMEWVNL